MNLKTIIAAAVLLLLLPACPTAAAQEKGLGLFVSPKGVGATFNLPSGKNPSSYNSFSVFADIYGMPMGKCYVPGYRAVYNRCNVIKEFSWRGADCYMYVGPGFSAGWVRDFEEGLLDPEVKYFHSPGAMAGIGGTFGFNIRCRERLQLNLSWDVEVGVFYRHDNVMNNMVLSIYRNGLIQLLSPQLTIIYTLR